MRKIYIDSEFKCHAANPDGIFREIETDFFDRKCDTFIEGYMYIPDNETWVRKDGKTFTGRIIFPWKNYSELDIVQRTYEQTQLVEYAEALKTVGVEVK